MTSLARVSSRVDVLAARVSRRGARLRLGSWVRFRGRDGLTRAHYVEPELPGIVVSVCGRSFAADCAVDATSIPQVHGCVQCLAKRGAVR